MTKLLNLDEMLEVTQQVEPKMGVYFKDALEAIGTLMACVIANRLDVECGVATSEGTAFAGTCASFRPKHPGQPCPEPLTHYDSEEWDDEADDDEAEKEIEGLAKEAGAALGRECREFADYLRACTDTQVSGVYQKETKAGRKLFADLAVQEAARRKIELIG